MRDITATEAARKFSDLLDAVEHRNESFVVRRGGKAIAHISPASASTGLVVKELLRRFLPDEKWEEDLTEVRLQLTSGEQRWSD